MSKSTAGSAQRTVPASHAFVLEGGDAGAWAAARARAAVALPPPAASSSLGGGRSKASKIAGSPNSTAVSDAGGGGTLSPGLAAAINMAKDALATAIGAAACEAARLWAFSRAASLAGEVTEAAHAAHDAVGPAARAAAAYSHR